MRDLTTVNDGIYRTEERIKATSEVFTPKDLVDNMCDRIPMEVWKDPTRTFLEPTFGSGNMLCRMLERRIGAGVSPLDALRTLYGMELMSDNVKLAKSRIKDVLKEHGQEITDEVEGIIEHNFVNTDFFKWNIQDWRPYNEGELMLREQYKDTVIPEIKESKMSKFIH